jgi:elongation factor 1-gamma
VLGSPNNSVISGAFIHRTRAEIMPVAEDAPDWDSYTYERIELENVEQQAFFEAALARDL